MKKMITHGSVLLLLLGTLFSTAAYLHRGGPHGTDSADTLFLLLPDSVNGAGAEVQEWLDTAAEEGLHLEIIRDSNFLDPMSRVHGAGLIVPDELHRMANDALVGALDEYVRGGGKLMLVYDACTWDLNGHFPELGSRLSSLTGVNYALYGEYGKKTMEQSEILGTAKAMEALGIPPGKFVAVNRRNRPTAWKQVAMGAKNTNKEKDDDARYTLMGYKYGQLAYPSFQTSGDFDGNVLLESDAGLVAGKRTYGAGEVLFVNIPLGYLESRTDGLLLHSFLRYFAVKMAQLPYLSTVPDGTGGLVLNWHIDARSALKSLGILRQEGIFNNGPFSMHMTAGPDVDEFHDGKGLNVDHDAEAQRWIEYFRGQGDEMGSHGGWIHNYFGENISDANQTTFAKYLEWNKTAMEHASGESMKEYSAPLGNQPEWVTNWLDKNGFIAYYFAGDSGMGPTRVYRGDVRDGLDIWAFPILHLGTLASLEEMGFDELPESTVQEWLLSIADFTAQEHVARLVYSHPLGATRYIHALQAWMAHSSDLARQGRFRWYTMTSLANFLNARMAVKWSVKASGHHTYLEASHTKTLDHQTWIFPKSRYGNLHVVRGKAEIRAVEDNWLITAGECTHLEIKMDEEKSGAKEAPRS